MIRYPFELSTTQQNHVGWLDVRQNDTGTQQFVATITTNDVTQDLTGLTAEFRTRQNYENVIIEKATITNAKNGVVEYVVSQYAMQQLGKNIGYFTFSKGDVEMFSTKDFCYYVNTSVTTFGLKGCDYIWRFEDLLEYVTDLANQSQVQLDKLINDVDGIQQQIDDMFALIASQGVLSADEVRQLLINFMSGEDIEVTVTSDFNTPPKIAGSNVENANNLKWIHRDSLILPNSTGWNAATQVYLNMLYKLDNVSFAATTAAGVSGMIPQMLTEFNALWILEKNFPSIFKNVSTTAGKVTIAKSKITKFQYKVWSKATGPASTLCSHSLYNPSSSTWGASTTSSGTSITQRNITSNNASTPAYLTADGFYYFLTYAEASNATSASSVSTDYASIDLTVKFNISDFVATKAQYDALKKVVDDHVADTVKHINAAERTKWNAKQDVPVDSGWIPAVTSGVTQDGAKPLQYRRIGNKMYFRGGGTFPTTAGATFLVIPVAYAPAGQAAYHDTIVRDSNPDHKCIIQVQSDGACRIITNSYAANPIFLDGFEYVIA
ncbi:phage baseplate upper protein [Carnobacterium maltaromaticum]|uniref:Phage baseplate upper protein n=1 Tax=Carnobacterium maltaromaticum TaxID=2751 RepID=A0AAW9K4R2_CARML|nr:phage baseplate upper protein [Carnobacterium maltaromaticum]MDZ5760781.1 phage baseplate upper protein [Carnobacterium maltaromaticum]